MAAKRTSGPIKRHHWFHLVIMVIGWVLPPLAVLVRFGVGKDFFINIICTLSGYIPGHGHNFFIQNIRNNKNSKHSPSWAVRAGLVKDYRKKRTGNGWADRYGEGQGPSYEDQEVIVDPVTGETRPEPRRQNDSGHHHHFPAPWADDADAPSPASENLSRRDTDGGELGRRSSRASLGSRYAERYGLGGDGSSENSGRARRGSRPSSLRSGSSTSHAGGGGGLFGRKKAQGKDRWAREADVMGPSHGDVFGADDMGGAGPLGNEYDQGRTGERTNGRTAQPAREEGQRRTINDPMEDNFEF